MVNFGAPFRVIDPRHPADSTWHRNVSIIGVHARHFVTETPGPKHCLVARLNPMGAHLLLRMPMNELVNRWVELDDIVSNTANRWREQLDAAETWHARFVLMDSLLLASFADRRATSPGLGWAWNKLQETGGQLNIDQLASNLGISHKHLIAKFHEHVGLTPKTVARLSRFNRLLRLGRGAKRTDWATTANLCGYYDQAHLIRDVRTFSGATPGELETLRFGFTLRANAAR